MGELLSYCSGVALQVGILFVLIFVGILITKFKIVNKTGIDQIIDILLYIVTPCLIVDSFLSVEYTKDTVTELCISAGCAALTHIIGAFIASVFAKTKPEAKRAVYRFGIVFSNGGFMSLPMAEALVGEKGVVLE